MNGIQLLAVIIGAVGITGVAHRRGLPAPLVVVVLASAVSFVPGVPQLTLEPKVILGVVLPPLLYSAALDMSVVSFARNVWSIVALGVGLVLVSTLTVGLVAGWVLGLSLPLALILGSVLAPPDAVAATALGRRWGLPRRLMTILAGESLVNDAAALTLFTVTAAAITGTRSVLDENPLLLFGYGAVVGIAIGSITAFLVHRIRCRLHEPALETVLGIVVPFTAYLAAEEVHASAVLAVVAAGFVLGHLSAGAGFATRLQSSQVWRTADVVLEAFVFAYLGLQLRFVVDGALAEGIGAGQLFGGAALVFLVLAAIRPAWIFLVFAAFGAAVDRLRPRLRALAVPIPARGGPGAASRATQRGAHPSAMAAPRLPWQYTVVRRLHLISPDEAEREHTEVHHALEVARRAARRVTATATTTDSAAPATGKGLIPHRPEAVPVADVVAMVPPCADLEPGLPGLGGRQAPVANRPPDRHDDADRTGQAPTVATATLRAVERHVEQSLAAREALQHRMSHNCPHAAAADAVAALVRSILAEQRRALIAERDAGRLDDEVLRVVLEQLDYEEAAAAAEIGHRL